MTREYEIITEGQVHKVVVSDDREAILAAKAAGTASVEVLGEGGSSFLTAYAVEKEEDVSREYLEQVVRRHLGLPWEILKTCRLLIREFCPGDEAQVPEEPEDGEGDRVFRSRDLLEAYIRSQYGFWGYGIWALTERETGAIIGKAGVTNLEWGSKENGEEEALELGYHIFRPWRGRGYGTEACEGILSWCAARGNRHFYSKTDASNEASAALLKKLGFRLTDQRYTEPGQRHNLFVRNY